VTQLKKTSQVSLVSAALIGLVHFAAQAETVPLQTGSQGATISGDNNQVIQVINQTIINRPGRGGVDRLENKKKKKQGQSSREREVEHREKPSRNHGHGDDGNED
jgi:hypothetical protein